MPTDAVADRGRPASTVQIDAFGPLAATVEGCPADLGPHKRRLLLAVLLCHPGSEVPSGELVQALWGDHPPVSAANNLRSYIFGLRRTLGAATISGSGRPGYRLHCESLSTDINRFWELCAEADRAAGRGDAQAARAALAAALALRRDRAFADVSDAPAVADEAGRLEERWLLAAEQRVELDLRLGRAAEVVGELTALTARQPYRENLARLLMLALHRSGRRPEAIAVFRGTAAALRRDLDIEPGAALTELHRTIRQAVPEPGTTVEEPGRIVWSAFDLALRTLTGGQQELLALLGLTPGRDLALPAAAALAGRPPADVEQDLLGLAGAGLLQARGGRFGFPEGFHSYVRDRLSTPPAARRTAAIERLYTWYRDAADAADRALHPGALRLPMTGTCTEPAQVDEQVAREWFAAESANLVAACLRDGPYPLRVRIADALGGYLWTSRELDTWSTVAREIHRAARSHGDLPAQTAVQVALAKIAECRCDYPQAVSRLADAVRLSREAGWRAAEAVALGSLAALQSELGDTRRAARQFGAVLVISRETGSRLQEGRTLVHLGILHREQGRLQPAYDSFQQALPLIEAESSLVGRAIIENNLAETCVLRGDFDEAHERAAEALRICRDVGHVSSTISAYVMLSAAGRGRGDARTAAHHAALALTVAARLDDAYLLGVAAHEAGAVHDALGEPAQAIEHHRTAYRMTARIRSRFLEVRHAIALAIAEHRLAGAAGRPPGPDLRQALGQARTGGYRGLEKAALAGLAEQRRWS